MHCQDSIVDRAAQDLTRARQAYGGKEDSKQSLEGGRNDSGESNTALTERSSMETG